MNNMIDEGDWNFLIRLLLAHFLSDFVFQTRRMVENKSWNSEGLLMHIAITVVTALALTGSIWAACIIGITHYAIDISKTKLNERYPEKKFEFFFADQAAHIFIILFVWITAIGKFDAFKIIVRDILLDYKISLVVLGYVFCIWPSAYIIRFTIQKLLMEEPEQAPSTRVQNGGKWIGQFERVIIFTFVLLSQYEAIGFLITGKSIIRFADREQLKSEYVLVGTMLSYALAIAAGALVNWLMS